MEASQRDCAGQGVPGETGRRAAWAHPGGAVWLASTLPGLGLRGGTEGNVVWGVWEAARLWQAEESEHCCGGGAGREAGACGPALEESGGRGAEDLDNSVFHAGARTTLPNIHVIMLLSTPMKGKHRNSLSPRAFNLDGAGETQGGSWGQGSPHSSRMGLPPWAQGPISLKSHRWPPCPVSSGLRLLILPTG